MQTIEQDLRHFVTDNFLYGQEDGRLSGDDSLTEKGIIDSTGVLELVSFLEQKYAIRIQDRELVRDNLDSLRRLTHFVERKLQDKSAPVEQAALRDV
jgi:acyl carrier protein